ncbi:MAG: hypothetical protein AABM30_00895 [Actinomycetota bacterium]
MSPAVAQRMIILAAVGLLAAVVGLAIASGRGGSGNGSDLPARVGSWYQARAAPMSRDLEGTTTACGVRLTAKSLGIADPVLPCGAKLYIGYRDQDVLTQVIAVGPTPGRARFGVTPALAQTLGIEATVTVRWGYPALE